MRATIWMGLVCMSGMVTGCWSNNVEPDTGTMDSAVEDNDRPEALNCDELTLNIIGEEPPSVGDTWAVYLYCDDAMMAGVMKLSFDPPDFAETDGQYATFLYAGTATMTLQVGSKSADQEVTVVE